MSEEQEAPVPQVLIEAGEVAEQEIVRQIKNYSADPGCPTCEGEADKAINLYMGDGVEVNDVDRKFIRNLFRKR